jgi:hypothetical protein
VPNVVIAVIVPLAMTTEPPAGRMFICSNSR